MARRRGACQTGSTVQFPGTKELREFRRMVGLDPRRPAADGVLPGSGVVQGAQTIDIDVCFGPPRQCEDRVLEVARVERDYPGTELFEKACRRLYAACLRHDLDPGFEL